LEGIKRIEKGFHNFKEINTVYYEASTITIEEMEDALRKAETYRGTLKFGLKNIVNLFLNMRLPGCEMPIWLKKAFKRLF
jgi:hypothetical protein